ncbi:MAG: hypothetical protein K8I03_06930 [Ignavibacteria bacterium]|nr:hypothetical protein [Ignavibacteria bacterium]
MGQANKFYIIIFILCIAAVNLLAQNKVNIKIKQPPPNQMGVGDMWNITLTNTTKEDLKIYLTGTATEEKDGLIVEGKSKVFTVKPGKSNYKYNDFSNAEVKYNNSKYKEIMLRTGNAPEGTYTICVTAYEETGDIAGQENCIINPVKIMGSITLITPEDGAELDPNQPIIFSWTPLPGAKDYTLRIVEIKGDQSPEVAMKTNKPVWEKSGITGTSIQVPSAFPWVDYGGDVDYMTWQVSSGDVQSEVWRFVKTTSTVQNDFRCTIEFIPIDKKQCCYEVRVTTNIPNVNLVRLKNVNPIFSAATSYSGWTNGSVTNKIDWTPAGTVTGTFMVGTVCFNSAMLPATVIYQIIGASPSQICHGEKAVNDCGTINSNDSCRVNAGPDDTVCTGETLQLIAVTNSGSSGVPFDQFYIDFSPYVTYSTFTHDTPPTVNGKNYCIKVIGKWSLWNNTSNCDPEWQIDAGYIIRNSSPDQKTSDYIMGDGNRMYNWWAKDKPLYQTRPIPDIYNPAHIYNYSYTGDGNPIGFKFYDCYIENVLGCHYSDNCGRLDFEITECGQCECSYQWSPAVNLSNPNIPNPVFTSSTPGVYTYTVTANCGGIISSDQVVITVIDCPDGCDCKTWTSERKVRYSDDSKSYEENIKCFSSLTSSVKSGLPVEFNSMYACGPNPQVCQTSYIWNVINSSNVTILSGSSATMPISFNAPSPSGLYKFIVYAYCGTKLCDSCGFTFKTKDKIQEKCDCEKLHKEKAISIESEGNTQNTPCGKTINIDLNKTINVTFPAYICNPSQICPPGYQWTLKGGSGIISVNESGTGQTMSYTFNTPGSYQLCYKVYCGKKLCDSCCMGINVKRPTGQNDSCNDLIKIDKIICKSAGPPPVYDVQFTFHNNSGATSYLTWINSPSGTISCTPVVLSPGSNILNCVFTRTGPPTSSCCFNFAIMKSTGIDTCFYQICSDLPPCIDSDSCKCDKKHKIGGTIVYVNKKQNSVNESINCNKEYRIYVGTTLTLLPTYDCIGNCEPEYAYRIGSGPMSSWQTSSFTTGSIYSLAQVMIYARCGQTICDSCKITVNVHIGWPPPFDPIFKGDGEPINDVLNTAREKISGSEIGKLVEEWYGKLKETDYAEKLVNDEHKVELARELIKIGKRVAINNGKLDKEDITVIEKCLKTLEEIGTQAPNGLIERVMDILYSTVGKSWDDIIDKMSENK